MLHTTMISEMPRSYTRAPATIVRLEGNQAITTIKRTSRQSQVTRGRSRRTAGHKLCATTGSTKRHSPDQKERRLPVRDDEQAGEVNAPIGCARRSSSSRRLT